MNCIVSQDSRVINLPSFRSYSNGRNHTRRSPSSAPSTRSSSYHSPTRAIALNNTPPPNNSRPSSPAMSTRHSTHGSGINNNNNSDSSIVSNRSSPQSPSPHSPASVVAAAAAANSSSAPDPAAAFPLPPQSPAHHRTSSGPTIAINVFSEPDPSTCKYTGIVNKFIASSLLWADEK